MERRGNRRFGAVGLAALALLAGGEARAQLTTQSFQSLLTINPGTFGVPLTNVTGLVFGGAQVFNQLFVGAIGDPGVQGGLAQARAALLGASPGARLLGPLVAARGSGTIWQFTGATNPAPVVTVTPGPAMVPFGQLTACSFDGSIVGAQGGPLTLPGGFFALTQPTCAANLDAPVQTVLFSETNTDTRQDTTFVFVQNDGALFQDAVIVAVPYSFGVVFPAIQQAQIDDGGRFLDGGMSRVSGDPRPPRRDGRPRPPWLPWLEAFAGFGSGSNDGWTPGYTYQRSGFQSGIDYTGFDNIVVGFMIGYSGTNLDLSGGVAERGRVDSAQTGVYGSWRLGPLRIAGVLGFLRDAVGTTRAYPGFSPGSNSHANQYASASEIGWTFTFGAFSLEPYLGVTVHRLDQGRISETGGGVANLNLGGTTTQLVRSIFGLRFGYRWEWFDMPWILDGRVRWIREYVEERRQVDASLPAFSGQTFPIAVRRPGHNGYTYALWLKVLLDDDTEAYLRFNGEQWNGQSNHVFRAGVRIEF